MSSSLSRSQSSDVPLGVQCLKVDIGRELGFTTFLVTCCSENIAVLLIQTALLPFFILYPALDQSSKDLNILVVPPQGFEPWTNGLQNRCSTTEL